MIANTNVASRPTVIEHVLGRLIGISDVFAVAGDDAFAVEDGIVNFRGIEWVGCCNELNAAYAADGYARIRGVGAVSTTYGVGELSAINGIAGSSAEHMPVFHLVGMPNMKTQTTRALVHHTFGNGEFDVIRRMAEPTVCQAASATRIWRTQPPRRTLANRRSGTIGFLRPIVSGDLYAAFGG
jgi:indolepyruvate decarboxylase